MAILTPSFLVTFLLWYNCCWFPQHSPGSLGQTLIMPGSSEASLLLILPFSLAPNPPLVSLAEVNLLLPTANAAVSLAATQRICFTLVLLCNRISMILSLCSVTLWSRKIFLQPQILFLETEIRHCTGHFLCVTARSLGLPDPHSSHCDQFSWLQLISRGCRLQASCLRRRLYSLLLTVLGLPC